MKSDQVKSSEIRHHVKSSPIRSGQLKTSQNKSESMKIHENP